MLLLSPEKLLVVLAVAMVVIGPDKLPKLAGQIGVVWRDLQKWRERAEMEARGVFPDLPRLDAIGQAVRSPLSLLDTLAKPDAVHDTDQRVPADCVVSAETPVDPFEIAIRRPRDGAREPRVDHDPDPLTPKGEVVFDPSMN